MDNLPGLDNLVANTAYLKAQNINRNKLRDEWTSLSLPKPRMSYNLQASVGRNYESLCEQQPIGKKLFQQFLLASNSQYMVATEFLLELSDWSFAEKEAREKAKQRILATFFQPGSRSFVSYFTGEAAGICKVISIQRFDEEMLDELREATRDLLRDKPFVEYLDSPYFYKFLQWKEYEKQKINDRYFYEFRTLGKGGFGEVSSTNPSILLLNMYTEWPLLSKSCIVLLFKIPVKLLETNVRMPQQQL